VSEQILNGTSARLGYSVSFTLAYARKYVTGDKSRTNAAKTKVQALDIVWTANATIYIFSNCVGGI